MKTEKIEPLLPLVEEIEKYPFFFLEFLKEFPDPNKWDKIFLLDKQLNPPYLLRKFFAQHGYSWIITKSVEIGAQNRQIESMKYKVEIDFTEEIEKDGKKIKNTKNVFPSFFSFTQKTFRIDFFF